VEADRALGRALMLAEQAGTPSRLAAKRMRVGEAHFHWGRWDEALSELQAADDLPLDVGHRLFARGIRALIAVHRDDRPATDAHLYGVEDLKITSGYVRVNAEHLMGAWAFDGRTRQPAHPGAGPPASHLRSARNPAVPRADCSSWMWLPDVVRLALAMGDPATATRAHRLPGGHRHLCRPRRHLGHHPRRRPTPLLQHPPRPHRGPRRRPDAGWGSLTPTGHKIAQRVAAGQSNPDIATQLLLSRALSKPTSPTSSKNSTPTRASTSPAKYPTSDR
jgi:hypothetical protein